MRASESRHRPASATDSASTAAKYPQAGQHDPAAVELEQRHLGDGSHRQQQEHDAALHGVVVLVQDAAEEGGRQRGEQPQQGERGEPGRATAMNSLLPRSGMPRPAERRAGRRRGLTISGTTSRHKPATASTASAAVAVPVISPAETPDRIRPTNSTPTSGRG